MADRRLDLPDGQYVQFKTRITHGDYKEIMKLWAVAREAGELVERQDRRLLMMVESWRLLDLDGNEVPLTQAGLDKVAPAVAVAAWGRADEILDELSELPKGTAT